MKHVIAFSVLFVIFAAHAVMSDPHGTYNNGTLEDAECLQESGEGYMQLYRDMERIWGTSDMINMIVAVGQDMNSRYPGRDRLQVEDISSKNGGDLTEHGSHEIGLDADIQFYKLDGKEHVSRWQGNNREFAKPMVNPDGSVSGNFDVGRNFEVMKSMFRHGRVARVFIDTNLKKSLCRYARETGQLNSAANVLRNLVHEPNHQDHFHVRLQCPRGANDCHGQVPRTSGPTGC
jgi:penicillin-insensitive murein endopeptidase